MTPAQTRLKASSVPMEMASARSLSVMKKARVAVNAPVRMVPTTGVFSLLEVQWNMGKNRPWSRQEEEEEERSDNL